MSPGQPQENLSLVPGGLLHAPDIQMLLQSFLEGRSARTIRAYWQDLADFRSFAGTSTLTATAEAPTDVQNYINRLKEAKASDKTVALHLQVLKSAFNHARRMQIRDDNPADPISVTVDDEVERELFNPTEAKLLLDAAEGEWKTLLQVDPEHPIASPGSAEPGHRQRLLAA